MGIEFSSYKKENRFETDSKHKKINSNFSYIKDYIRK